MKELTKENLLQLRYKRINPKLQITNKQLKKHTFNEWKNRDNDQKKRFLDYCEHFEKVLEEGIGIIVYGKSGTGKTFISDCIYNQLNKDYVILKTTLNTILDTLKNSFNKDSGAYTIQNLLWELQQIDLLIIDDLGSEKLTEWSKDILFSIIDCLYTNEKCLIVTTNFDRKGMEKFTELNGTDKILSRLEAMCVTINYNEVEVLRKVKSKW